MTSEPHLSSEYLLMIPFFRHWHFIIFVGSTPSTEPLNTIGFYAYLGAHDTTPAANKVIVFDTVKVNVANAYNRYSGVFTAPEAGVYVFSWTMECDGGGSLFTQVVRNNEVMGSIATDSGQESEYRMSTGLVLVLANKGDAVFVRVHYVHQSRIHSSDSARSTFSGWKINWYYTINKVTEIETFFHSAIQRGFFMNRPFDNITPPSDPLTHPMLKITMITYGIFYIFKFDNEEANIWMWLKR